MGMWACARFLRVAAYASKSHRPFQHRLMSHSPPSLQMHDTNVPSHISNFKKRYSTFCDPPFCFSLQLTQCTSTGRLGTSCLVQRRTKTRPTSASTTPPRVKKPLHIFSDSRTRPPSYPSSSPSCVLQSYIIISCRFVQSYPPFSPENLCIGRRLYSNMHFQNYFLKT